MSLIGQPRPESVTREQFSKWKNDPVTQHLHLDLIETLLEALDTPIADSIDEATAITLKREGAVGIVEEVLEWEPQSVKDAKAKEGSDDS